MTLEQLCQEAQQLRHPEKGVLISRLLSDFGTPEYDVSDEEVLRRKEDLESGAVVDISHEELVSGLEYVK